MWKQSTRAPTRSAGQRISLPSFILFALSSTFLSYFICCFLFPLVTPRPKGGKGHQCDGAASSLDTTDRRLPFERAGVSLSAQSLPRLAAGTSRPIRQPRVPRRCSVALRPGVLRRDRPFENGAQRCISSIPVPSGESPSVRFPRFWPCRRAGYLRCGRDQMNHRCRYS